MSLVWSGLYVVLAAAVAATFQGGFLKGGDAFFLAASVVVIFVGHWLLAAEKGRATQTIAQTSWLSSGTAFAVCVGIASVVATQALRMA